MDVTASEWTAAVGRSVHTMQADIGAEHPRRFRQLAGGVANMPFAAVLARILPMLRPPDRVLCTARVSGGPSPVVVGLFPTGIPQGVPAACAIVSSPEIAAFGDFPDGRYHVLVMSFTPSTTVAQALAADDPDRCFVGSGPVPVVVAGGRVEGSRQVVVRLRPIDPPMVLALPLVVAATALI